MSDVIVVGAGPAGRALAARLAVRDVDVTLVDPHAARPWSATYGCWTDELPEWLDAGTIAAQTAGVRVYTSTQGTDVPRGYSIFDSAALATSLHSPRIRHVTARAVRVDDRRVTLDDGRVLTGVVIDARGTSGAGPRQTAFGVMVAESSAAPVLDGAPAILMDWRPASTADRPDTFLYAVPLGDGRVLLEETCLIGDPAPSPNMLRERLFRRLDGFGILPADTDAIERVSFRVTGTTPHPWRASPLLFGARAGLMHPATGYSVAASLSVADEVATALSAGADPRGVLWPAAARTVHRLRHIGSRALLRMGPDATAGFFGTFFGLPVDVQRTYLSSRTDVAGVGAAMARTMMHTDMATRWTLARAAIPGG
ncbi:lycopene cyclase family protein [Gordonia sp. ABSL1-1]|uniref:lycopene cyclase family protein n=1 Tax=Gordonia sp. ABSL1-1 TaxID=3053923 RepID=UPI002573D7DF|nr:lycopene cyclase family protein [Gordonia sp. ABSL1-1]MDL9935840.1 lycopene cyclase family protein [Gordonia sp. ABSL1-1]